MSSDDLFEVTFSIGLDRRTAWGRLTQQSADLDPDAHLWLPGFDSSATVVDAEPPSRLRVTKDDEPCANTEIVVTLEDEPTGTIIHVVQSGFGDWIVGLRDMMEVGWHLIVADFRTYLATGVHPQRFLRSWTTIDADARAGDGAVRIGAVQADGVAARLGLADGDLLVELDGGPITSCDDLLTVLRVTAGVPSVASWIRDGSLMHTPGDV